MRRQVRVIVIAAVLALVVSACQWQVVGFGASRSGSSSVETAIKPENVGQLAEQWRAQLVGAGTAPVVDAHQVYVSAAGPPDDDAPGAALSAFDATGTQGCSGTPRTCVPRWSKFFNSPNGPGPSSISAPAVADDRVYVGEVITSASLYQGPVHAYDATGAPVFTAGNGAFGSPAPAGGLVFSSWTYLCCGGSGSYRGFQAQDAGTGAVRFGALVPDPTSPAVSGDVVYLASASSLTAYDAHGTHGCAPPPGSPFFVPIVCDPLWTGTLTGPVDVAANPAVANGLVYQPAKDGRLDVFPASGCGAATCAPSWTAATGSPLRAAAAVTASTAFVASGSTLYAFPAAGCGAAACTALWTAPLGSTTKAAPSVAGNVVYIGADDGHLEAFDARGCGHATCLALWSASTGGAVTTAPAISNGRVFVADEAGTLHAYGLPPG